MKKFLLLILGLLSISAYAQKKPLDHSVYDSWKSVGGFNMTDDGKYTMFYINPQEGDNNAVAFNFAKGSTFYIPRANKVKVAKDNHFAIMNIKPLFEDIKEAKRKKKKSDDMPKDTLAIYDFVSGNLVKFPRLKSMDMGKDASHYIAFQSYPAPDTSKGKKAPKKDKEEGTDLYIYSLEKGITDTIKFVSSYSFDNKGENLYFVRIPNSKDSITKRGLFVYEPASKQEKTVLETIAKQTVKLPQETDSCSTVAFYAKLDTTKANKDDVSIFIYNKSMDAAKEVVNKKSAGVPENWIVSENRALGLSKDGKRLFFGLAPTLPKKDTSIIESEVAKLDIWHYKDSYNQPMQLIGINRELKKSYLSTIDLSVENPSIVQLANEEIPLVYVPNDWNNSWGFAVTDKNYELESQWSANPRCDLYIVDINTGNSKALLKDVYLRNVSSSEEGRFLIWFDCKDYQWYSYDHNDGEIRCMTKGIGYSFADELHDTPEMNFSYGHGGWAKGDKYIYLNDRYDVWQIDPSGKESPVNMTEGKGRSQNITFRIVRLDKILLPPGTPGVKLTPIEPKTKVYFSAFDNNNKWNGYYYKDFSKKRAAMTEWIMQPYTFMYLNRSKDGKVMTYVKHNFSTSPDVWYTKDNFKKEIKLTDINPQQRDYNWGTNELVKWRSKNGFDCQGILYKPEDFDSTKKYPMIVYFYERRSDYLNYYMPPAPSRSTVNITYFTSNGYLVFMPDIHYTIGHPGKSALDCIVPGVEMICENSWADRENVAIQGQSWGGYQVAYMITQPQVFKWKAAGAGAPVSNMTSAYGGIRWGSGMVRQFQYEHTQSRIGKTLWDGFDLYIENSPLFFANQVETPVLIMSNDKDEAVPWYQGIEYFTALRRLGKPAWMLQYNNETHNLSNRVNAKDLSVRLSQFFDHYLKGAPMPVWMKRGVPATLKGIDWGLGYE